MNIEAMARESFFRVEQTPSGLEVYADCDGAQHRTRLAHFAALVRAKALREAAGICSRQDVREQACDWEDFSAAILAAIDQPKEK